ncbi:1-phosphatidylinositol phosphodiesterase [Fistulifera solaris]|uniref:1-phosphatidylinositol phosphodiesterase n=1 Tax=Fistulifera solaris TaxID=1519565 RepID=A0A1Z5KKX1_FISSO|nr:1-phosphatidylinositol phosphodiesterase [Fistulifera solaris]|eukprot:GAX26722.1 1-phosphatidylinositol phosphodiesterase [Fistulifera solaris]
MGGISLRHAPLATFISTGTEDWMSFLDDSTPLSQISIPGTHDSAAAIGRPLCDTQNWNLLDQLRSGVRYLDIRCRPVDNYFNIHHGICFLHQRFDDVLKVVSAFLSDHPGETLIMRVSSAFRPSHDAQSFEQIWNRYMLDPTYGAMFVPNLSSIPTLGEVRGRIIVVSNDLGPRSNFGYQFFGGSFTSIQDEFEIDSDEKVAEKVELVFTQMENAPLQPGRLTFNHLSGTGLPDLRYTPEDVAVTTNNAAYDLIGFGDFKRLNGISIADYPGEGLISRIILSNFGEELENKLRTQNQFQLFSTTNCEEGKQVGYLDYPYPGGSVTTRLSDEFDAEDNSARSVLLSGPVEAGTRIFVGGLSDLLGKSDSTIITVVEDVLEGGSICIENLRKSTVESQFVQTYQEFAERKTNLPSSVRVERPTDEYKAFAVTLTRELHWTGRFCAGKSSEGARGGPVIGILRSHIKGCQSLAQSKTKICAGESSYWTTFVSLLRKSNQCRKGYYVGQTKCLGLRCSRMMIRCYKTSSLCSLDANGPTSVRKLRYGDEGFCPFGSILTGVECQRPACTVLTAYCTKLTYTL